MSPDLLSLPVTPPAAAGEPEWAVAHLFPPRGCWREGDYLALPAERPVELVDGCLEILPTPTEEHDDLEQYLFEALLAHVRAGRLGRVRKSGVPVRVAPGRMRLPDVSFVLREQYALRKGGFLDGADLVMEVISPGGRVRDTEEKVADHAAAGVREYWIIDPEERHVSVLALENGAYVEHGCFRAGQTAQSQLLPGFGVDIAALFGSVGAE